MNGQRMAKDTKAASAVDKKDTKKAAKQGKNTSANQSSIFSRLRGYLKDVRSEVKRVVWPTKQEVINSSLVVVAALVFFGVFIYLIDTAVVPALLLISKIG